MLTLSRLARRTAHLLTLEAFGLTVFVFPMQVSRETLTAIHRWVMEPAHAGLLRRWRFQPDTFYEFDLAALINSGHDPLILKEGLMKATVILALIAWAVSHIARAQRREERRVVTFRLFWLVLTVTVLTGSLFWGTRVGEGDSARRVMVWLQSRSYFIALAGLAFLMLLTDFLRSGRMADRWIGWVYVVTTPVALTALLQHLATQLTTPDTYSWLGFIPVLHGKENARNVVGSLIGHNNGASLMMIPGLCLAPGVWRRTQRHWIRVLLALWVILAAWLVVRGQSRSLALSVMFALAVWIVISRVWLPRPEKKVITPTARRWILIGAVAFLAFQLFPNPLRATAGMGAHFRRLIDHSDLLTDTRVRVAFAGMPAFQEKFVLGHGIGSFSYVYPRFQGNYFLGHPNTPLDLTDKVTQRAHNDWLQLLIEMGVAGLAVVLWGLHLFWRRGWDFARSGRCPELQRPLLGGALVAGLVFMFQALFDFPMHVVPTAMTALLMAALVGNAPEVFGQQRFATPRSISRPGLIARWLLLGALAIWCLWPPKIWVVAKTPLSTSPATMAPSLPLLMSRVAGGVMADARHVRALADVDWYSRPGVRESPQGIQWLRSAARNLDEAVRLDPSSGFIQHTRGEVFTYLGAYDRQFYNRALESFDVATEEVRNFRTHYFLGECHYGLSRYAARDAAELEERGDAAGAQQARALEALQTQQAINWYEQALKLNPSDGHSADTQAKLLLRAGGTSAAVGTLRMMHRWAPQMYNERWVDATKPLINFGEHERALERLSVLRQVEPNNLVFPAMAAEVYVRRRDLDRARRTVEEGKQRWPEHRHLFEFIEAELNIVEGDLEAPVTLLRDVASRWESADVLLLEHLTLRMLGRADEANQPYAEAMTLLIAQGKDERTAAMTLGNFAWELFEDPETAEIYYRTTIENPPGPAILMNTRMAQRAMERGDRQRARALLEAVRQSSQGYALFQTLWAELNPEESPDGN